MQLVACGAQDIFLTGSPMISYFKTVYRRHTNFAIETIKQTFDGGQPGFGSTVVSTLSRNGDLVSAAYLQASLPDLTEKASTNFSGDVTSSGVAGGPGRRYVRWVDNIGHYLVKSVEVSIGGSVIDRHYSDWLEIWAQLTVPAGKMTGYRKMIGQDPKNAMGQNTGLQADVLTSLAQLSDDPAKSYGIKQAYIVGRDIFIPLQFWFCRNIGLALPLIALQYHDVRIHVTFRSAEDLIQVYAGDSTQATGPTWVAASDYENYVTHQSLSVNLWVDYVFLDADERRRFAQVSHEYLIEQVQYQEDTCVSGANKSIALNFNHPVKELLWVAKGFESTREWSNFTDTQLPPVPPFQALQIQNNQLNEGLTGLPTETYIPVSKLSLTITTDINITGQISSYFTATPNSGYIMTNGDIITINANGDTNTNVSLAVVSTADGVATSFYTKELLTRGLTYNKVVSITRFKDFVPQNAQKVNISIKADRILTGVIDASTTGLTVFSVAVSEFAFEIDDTIYMKSGIDSTKQLILRVLGVTASGVPTTFRLLTTTEANILYDVPQTINRGAVVEVSPYITINIFNGCGSIPPGATQPESLLAAGSVLVCEPGEITAVANGAMFQNFLLPYGFSAKVGDVFELVDINGNIRKTTVLDLAGDNATPIKFSNFDPWQGVFTSVRSVVRNGNLVNVDVTKFIIFALSGAVGPLYAPLYTPYYVSMKFFHAVYKPSYEYKVGDVITMGLETDCDFVVNRLDSFGLPSSITLLNRFPYYTYEGFTTAVRSTPVSNIKKITRNGVAILRNDLIINLIPTSSTPHVVGMFINASNTSRFFVQPVNGYVMSVGDVIKVTSDQFLYPTSSHPDPSINYISLSVSKVIDGIATEFQTIPPTRFITLLTWKQWAQSRVDYNLTKVISITAANTANSVRINLLSSAVLMPNVQNNLSDIKTYDDLMRFSNYDSVRPYNSVTGSLAGNPISKAGLIMNRTDRFLERPGTYFSLVQPRNHHTNIPVSPGINIYSFALKPEEHQPSGACNFSRIEDATLRIKTGDVYSNDEVKPNVSLLIKIFAVSYNILRIVNGMGGLAYN